MAVDAKLGGIFSELAYVRPGGAGGFCRIKQFLDLKRVDFIEVNLPKFA